MSTMQVALLLAQMCVSEISFQPDSEECLLMVEVNQRNADRRGITLERQTKSFNAIFDPRTHVRRAWIFNLNHYGTMPTGWNGTIHSWNYRKPMFLNYLNSIKRWLKRQEEGLGKPMCYQAEDYGGNMDKLGDCAVRVNCLRGHTLQTYYNLRQCRHRVRGHKDVEALFD